ncbi:MAG: flagellar M-ring protein FliF [Candidatus Eisenbacteria bacterium]|uniref:Flagellar M-ring protein n=1 Tax=Eiseniibacteriota bacterium TaxID=2212470 RepID=A0A948W7F6_UNCEI|nr:flagellar M-ring protein FliF [Candidatus Eisenbacteria bacterium]MBU1950942.1 flagellar M-ring protein FliF [Candidatus Eisenbacteria bacterium]MBU2692185.1 flagellar M-ring protein FliF [Candidatus Eisenbacteria bacterium]
MAQFFSISFIGRLFHQLTPGQRLLTLTLGGALIVTLILLSLWASSPEYAILYARLDPEEAGSIVERLQSEKVDYELRDGGTTVVVPKDKVYEARLSLANQGLPRTGSRGYEIMDQGKMGWTDFIQKFQHRRALEGEIARTIQTLEEIQQARVHLVIPEESLFQEDQNKTTASVVVRLNAGARLASGHVRGIVHLVASAVEGLETDNVTILDTAGNLLSNTGGTNFAASSDQMELTRNVEDHLARKAQSMLEAVLGPNKAIVRLTAELDWEKVDRTIETYDAENPAIISEQTTSGTNSDGSSSESSTTNYEFSKRMERVLGSAGTLKKLTGAVFIDGTYTVDENGVRQYTTRSAEEMQKLTQLIKAALGFSNDRGDELNVENIAFDTTSLDTERQEMEKTHKMQQVIDIVTRIGGLIIAVLLIFAFRGLLKKMYKRPATPEAEIRKREIEILREPEGDPLELEVRRLSNESPDVTARLIRAWMHEG